MSTTNVAARPQKAAMLVAQRIMRDVKAHDEIYQALKARDPDGSEERMREHIHSHVRYAERKFPELLDEVIRWDRMMG